MKSIKKKFSEDAKLVSFNFLTIKIQIILLIHWQTDKEVKKLKKYESNLGKIKIKKVHGSGHNTEVRLSLGSSISI